MPFFDRKFYSGDLGYFGGHFGGIFGALIKFLTFLIEKYYLYAHICIIIMFTACADQDIRDFSKSSNFWVKMAIFGVKRNS